jgi:sulfur carrier protein
VQILVNGREQETSAAQTVEELLKDLGYQQSQVAVALDGEFLPRRLYAATKLQDQMDLEILLPMQGG